ncbi:hypothetical protein ACP70R_049071 [Stipagrostis hirtigluma subsp. patula]
MLRCHACILSHYQLCKSLAPAWCQNMGCSRQTEIIPSPDICFMPRRSQVLELHIYTGLKPDSCKNLNNVSLIHVVAYIHCVVLQAQSAKNDMEKIELSPQAMLSEALRQPGFSQLRYIEHVSKKHSTKLMLSTRPNDAAAQPHIYYIMGKDADTLDSAEKGAVS